MPHDAPATGPSPLLSRRRLLAVALPGAAALAGLPGGGAAAAAALRAPERQLALHHCHTGESLRAVYFADGSYLPEALRQISHVLRDWRNDQVKVIDPRVLDIVYLLQQRLALKGPLEVICGYRSPATNAMLRRRSRGVARNSLHMDGKALDISFRGPALAAVHRAALELGVGGVGYYPGSGFIHLDSGAPRQWQQGAVQGPRCARARAARLRKAGRRTAG
jgi:uncharacterized protein YcbK (DUF882 family)